MKSYLIPLIICWTTLSQLAYAYCSQPQPRLVWAEFSASKVVLEATLVKIDNETDKNDSEAILGHYYTLKTDRVYRGTPEQTIRIYEGNDSGRASFRWKIGTRYILFLFDSYEKAGEHVLSLDGCGNSGPVVRAASTLRGIDRIKNLKENALIAGTVSVYNLSAPMREVEVEARGGGKIYRASTDRNGRFRIEVPPGHYSVEPKAHQLSFKVYEMSYEDSQLTMQPGTCAQVQFIERAPPGTR